MSEGLQLRLKLGYPGFDLDLDLALPGSGISALFGPSGSGKTTCLRAIAGLERAREGRVVINGEIWQDQARGIFLPTHRRALAYVFQDARLFEHLDVRGNLRFGLKRASAGTTADWDGIIDMLDIAQLLDRRPDRLSGGERQRVAIARALLSDPKLILLDEPLASLDDARKAEILPYLERLHQTLRIPAIHVSHSIDEVARLADHLVLLEAGRVVASGPLRQTLARIDLPARWLARAGVVIEATVSALDPTDQLATLSFRGGELLVPARDTHIGARLRCRIEARDVSLSLEAIATSSILNRLPVTIIDSRPGAHPALQLVQLHAAGEIILAEVTRRSWTAMALQPGQQLWAQIKAVALVG
jgi:molybdate transport system ATP-binding protein